MSKSWGWLPHGVRWPDQGLGSRRSWSSFTHPSSKDSEVCPFRKFEARLGWDTALIPALLCIHRVLTSFSLSSIIISINDCLHDYGSGLSQDQSFNLTWAPRGTSKCLMLPSSENTVYVCVLFGIVYVVHPVLLFTSTIPEACTVGSLYAKAEGEEKDLRPLAKFLNKAGTKDKWPWFPSWSQNQGSRKPKEIEFRAVFTCKVRSPQMSMDITLES